MMDFTWYEGVSLSILLSWSWILLHIMQYLTMPVSDSPLPLPPFNTPAMLIVTIHPSLRLIANDHPMLPPDSMKI
jgi:hypothetical protein